MAVAQKTEPRASESGSAPAPYDIAVVMVVRDRAPLTLRALMGLASGSQGARFQTVVVDDGSCDATPALLRSVGGDFVALREDRARGFAAGCDRAVAAAQSSVIAVVREDLVATAGWLAPLTAAFDDPQVGAVQPRVIDVGGRDVTGPGWPSLAVRREVIAQVGGFLAAAQPGLAVKASFLAAVQSLGWRVSEAPLSVLLALPEAVVAD